VSPQRERKALIPRRALFDVRMQIMAEEEEEQEDEEKGGQGEKKKTTTAKASLEALGLGDADISQDVYEGGFKSWEGAMDLARLVLERGPRKDIDDLERCEGVVEVSLLCFGSSSFSSGLLLLLSRVLPAFGAFPSPVFSHPHLSPLYSVYIRNRIRGKHIHQHTHTHVGSSNILHPSSAAAPRSPH